MHVTNNEACESDLGASILFSPTASFPLFFSSLSVVALTSKSIKSVNKQIHTLSVTMCWLAVVIWNTRVLVLKLLTSEVTMVPFFQCLHLSLAVFIYLLMFIFWQTFQSSAEGFFFYTVEENIPRLTGNQISNNDNISHSDFIAQSWNILTAQFGKLAQLFWFLSLISAPLWWANFWLSDCVFKSLHMLGMSVSSMQFLCLSSGWPVLRCFLQVSSERHVVWSIAISVYISSINLIEDCNLTLWNYKVISYLLKHWSKMMKLMALTCLHVKCPLFGI